jgi:hypothetical protein
MQKGLAMGTSKVPTNVWMVVDVANNGWTVVSTHDSQRDAETERDRRNEGLARRRYSACIATKPTHEAVQACRN